MDVLPENANLVSSKAASVSDKDEMRVNKPFIPLLGGDDEAPNFTIQLPQVPKLKDVSNCLACGCCLCGVFTSFPECLGCAKEIWCVGCCHQSMQMECNSCQMENNACCRMVQTNMMCDSVNYRQSDEGPKGYIICRNINYTRCCYCMMCGNDSEITLKNSACIAASVRALCLDVRVSLCGNVSKVPTACGCCGIFLECEFCGWKFLGKEAFEDGAGLS